MIIFQTAGGGDASSFRFGAIFEGSGSPATTFRNNSYIHRLNRALQAEMRAISAYNAARRQLEHDAGELPDSTIPIHQSAGRELVNLIISNRGIPEDKTALSFGLTKTLISACRAIPDPVAFKATLSTLHGIERHLVSSYTKLKKDAPRRDLAVLDQLLQDAVTSCSLVERYRR